MRQYRHNYCLIAVGPNLFWFAAPLLSYVFGWEPLFYLHHKDRPSMTLSKLYPTRRGCSPYFLYKMIQIGFTYIRWVDHKILPHCDILPCRQLKIMMNVDTHSVLGYPHFCEKTKKIKVSFWVFCYWRCCKWSNQRFHKQKSHFSNYFV